MNIAFIGAGKVGISFGKYLHKNNFKIAGYYSKTYTSALKAAKLTDSKAFQTLEELKNASLIFITTPDDVIEEVCNLLVHKKLLNKNHIICHMSGVLSADDVLLEAKKIGCSIYSVHPLQAFADIENSVKELKNTYFCIEGCSENLDKIKNILHKTGNKYFLISSKQKTLYHAAACITSNYLITLLHLGTNLLEEIGINEDDGIKAMAPLIKGTVKNFLDLGPENALTGPIARGDIKTIQKHLKEIQVNSPQNFSIYKKLGEKTLKLAVQKKLSNHKKIEELKKLLGG